LLVAQRFIDSAFAATGNAHSPEAKETSLIDPRSLRPETMITATTNDQQQLFAPPPPPPNTEPPNPQPEAPDQPAAAKLETVTTEELLQHIFQSMCSFRRFERELLFGASDEELGKIFGHCFCMGQGSVDLEFRPEGEPALIVRDSTFKIEVTTLTAQEISQYLRRITGIPYQKSAEDRTALLATFLDEERTRQRASILPYVRSLMGEKNPRGGRSKKSKNQSSQPPQPTLGERIANLLFENDCLTEASDRRLLLKIVRLLIREQNLNALKAVKLASSIVDSARGHWRSMACYWLGIDAISDDHVHYQPASAPPP
jgi:hypothetical protein